MLPSRIFLDDFFDDLETKKVDKMMKCDVYEEDNAYVIEMDAPGVKKENIELEYHEGNLTITMSTKKSETDNKKYLRRERVVVSKCSRSFYLGDIDENEIRAEFKDGILKISVPKENKNINHKKIINIVILYWKSINDVL